MAKQVRWALTTKVPPVKVEDRVAALERRVEQLVAQLRDRESQTPPPSRVPPEAWPVAADTNVFTSAELEALGML
jgi:hypothetical protein